MTDGSRLFEVVTAEGERIADCTNEVAAHILAENLNTALDRWFERDPADRNLSAGPGKVYAT